MQGRKIAFTFNPRSIKVLEEMTQVGKFSSFAETIRESLIVAGAIQIQAEHGFDEVIVRNRKTSEERQLILPSLVVG